MTRGEAVAIVKARPARASLDGPIEQIDAGALKAIAAAKASALAWLAARRRWPLRRAMLWGAMWGLAAGWLAASLDLRFVDSGASLPLWGAILIGIGAGLVVYILCVAITRERYPDHDPDLDLARRLIGFFAQEAEDLARVRARATSGLPFALYLRTFSTETNAITKFQAYMDSQSDWAAAYAGNDMLSPAAAARQNRMLDQLAWRTARGEWEAHLAIIATMARFAPVLCLGNARMPDHKREDLRKLGVDEVVLLKTDWWPVLVELAARATLVVVFVSEGTANIDRELSHLAASDRPFIIASSLATHDMMMVSEAYRAALSSRGARHVVIEGEDTGALAEAISAAGMPPARQRS